MDVEQWLPSAGQQSSVLEQAIRGALTQRTLAPPQPYTPITQDPWGQAPAEGNPRDNPNFIRDPRDHSPAGQAELGAFGAMAPERAMDKFSGYADFSWGGLADALGIATDITNPVGAVVSRALSSAVTGSDPAPSVQGSLSFGQLNDRALAMGTTMADLAARNRAQGMSPSIALGMAAERAYGALGGAANAAIGRAPTTAERDRAYGPGFGGASRGKGPAASRTGGPGQAGASY